MLTKVNEKPVRVKEKVKRRKRGDKMYEVLYRYIRTDIALPLTMETKEYVMERYVDGERNAVVVVFRPKDYKVKVVPK